MQMIYLHICLSVVTPELAQCHSWLTHVAFSNMTDVNMVTHKTSNIKCAYVHCFAIGTALGPVYS